MTKTAMSEYLFNKFLEWEKNQPEKRSTYSAFARFLSDNSWNIEIKQQLLSGWLNGDFQPSLKYAAPLAEKLGNEIYGILNIPKPDPRLQAITSRWDRIPLDKQLKLAEDAAHYEVESEEENEHKKISRQARSGARP